jgi:hypothetical protein
MDDTSIVVAEVVEWTEAHNQIFQAMRSRSMCGAGVAPCTMCVAPWDIDQYDMEDKQDVRSFDRYEDEEEEEEVTNCKMS